MKILFVGDTAGTSTSAFYYTSLLKLGHTVLPWYPGFWETRGLAQKLQVRLSKHPLPSRVRQVNDHLISLCRQNAFDLVFVMGELFFERQTLETIRQATKRAPRFLFHSHDNLFFHELKKGPDFFPTLAAFDVAFTTKSQNEARYRELGQKHAYYIPSAYEPAIHRPISTADSRLDRAFDVSFVGTYDDSRLPYLAMAGWERLHVWGNDWTRFADYAQHATHIHPHAIYYFEFADVCSRSRCSLGLLREEAEDRHTQRTFEINACASLQLAPRNEEIQGFYEEGKEIVLFESPEELKDKLDYYLGHESERAKIARAGYERTLRDRHTYADRVGTMLQILSTI